LAVQLGDIVNVGNIQQMTMQLKNVFNYIPINQLIGNYHHFIFKLKI